jgi:hypothetical protein
VSGIWSKHAPICAGPYGSAPGPCRSVDYVSSSTIIDRSFGGGQVQCRPSDGGSVAKLWRHTVI